MSPPSAFTIVKGALESSNKPVLERSYGSDEHISLYVMRLSNPIEEEDVLDQLFLHVEISKPTLSNSLQFLCGLYPDALGIHSVALRPSLQTPLLPTQYAGPSFGYQFHSFWVILFDSLYFGIKEVIFFSMYGNLQRSR